MRKTRKKSITETCFDAVLKKSQNTSKGKCSFPDFSLITSSFEKLFKQLEVSKYTVLSPCFTTHLPVF